ACGSCIKVCRQEAKATRDSVSAVRELFRSSPPVVACLAPSFPAAFPQAKPGQIISAVRSLGFAEVTEVAFAADLVGKAHAAWAKGNEGKLSISSPCPALVLYIRKYFPSLVPYVAPIVSPMAAMGRIVKQVYRPGAKVVFIGPCVAKKAEIDDPEVLGDIDAVLTFVELDRMFQDEGLAPERQPASEPDGPLPSVGRAFPIPGGLLRSASMKEDICSNRVIVTEGTEACAQILNEVLDGAVEAEFLDLLFCDGCISGPAFPNELSVFARKQLVAKYVQVRSTPERDGKHAADMDRFGAVDLRRSFTPEDHRLPTPSYMIIREILRRTNKIHVEDELNCGACGYNSCREKASAVFWGLAENEMCLPYLIDQLEQNLNRLAQSHQELQETQQQLIQSEKMASVGQLAAGVAHEINNPLGTILLYSHMILEKLEKQDTRREELETIAKEANRCRDIVRGLLDFARQRKLQVENVDVNKILRETLSLAAGQPAFRGVAIEQSLDPRLPFTGGDPVQLKEVFLNILSNAGDAMAEGGKLTVTSRYQEGAVNGIEVMIRDTGQGIPPENLDKIFMPFFTTKKIGQGTGLGLAIAYGIVKMHRGAIDVKS
ncbi:MAG TPA: [Fe-Fe] hydrogenase large subunit C-terminal domain-containing protein, partial [Thermodesulfobacteriota bacterium]|nr:[Fe-Fe] hydrogenase large subunit C-terminal domain-containing protein [Thermodesulfobacteriota bacterium]